MNYNEVFNAFLELKSVLENKKQAIIKKNLEQLSAMDEATIVLVEKINKYDLKNNDFSQEEKDNLKKLGEEIKVIHGVGEGILLKEIRSYLKTDKNVLEYRRGKYGEGENGVTIIKLK